MFRKKHSPLGDILYQLSPTPSPLYPVLGNPVFSNDIGLVPFMISLIEMIDRNIFYASQFKTHKGWPSFNSLRRADSLYHLDVWKALQVCHLLLSLPAHGDFNRQLTAFGSLCTQRDPLRHSLSQSCTPSSPNLQKMVFLFFLLNGAGLEPQKTCRLLYFTLKSPLCTKIQEINLKSLSR